MLLSAAYFMYECTKFQGAIQYREKTLSKCDMVIFTQPTVLHKKIKGEISQKYYYTSKK